MIASDVLRVISLRYSIVTLALCSLSAACVSDEIVDEQGSADQGIRDGRDMHSVLDLDADRSDADAIRDAATPVDGDGDGADGAVDSRADALSSDQNAGIDAGRDAETGDLAQDSGGGEDDGTTEEDSGDDLGGQDSGPVAQTCMNRAVMNQTFAAHTGGFDGQLYSRAAYDGRGIWVVFAMRETAETGTTDIWATRLDCDGSALLAPFKVSDPVIGVLEVYPVIAQRDGAIFIAWVEDTSSTDQVKMRAFDADGSPRQSAAMAITPSVGGAPVSGLLKEIDIAAVSSDEAALSATFYSLTDGNDQIAVQRFRDDGTLLGEAFQPVQEKNVQQSKPSITALNDGTLHVAWTRYKPADPSTGAAAQPHRVVSTRIAPGALVADLGGPFAADPASTLDNQLGRYSKEITAQDRVYLAFQSDSTGSNDILLKREAFGPSLSVASVGNSGFDLRPSVSAREDGLSGAVTWFRVLSSISQGEIHVQRFDASATGQLSFGADMTIPTIDPARAPYGPTITHLFGDVYFVGWQEGPSASKARVMGRLITL